MLSVKVFHVVLVLVALQTAKTCCQATLSEMLKARPNAKPSQQEKKSCEHGT